MVCKDVFIDSFSLCVHAKMLQLCPTLCNPMDCSLPGSSVREILQARILEYAALSFSKGSPRPRDRALGLLPCSRIFYHPSHLGSAALRCTAQHTKAQPLVEGACT